MTQEETNRSIVQREFEFWLQFLRKRGGAVAMADGEEARFQTAASLTVASVVLLVGDSHE